MNILQRLGLSRDAKASPSRGAGRGAGNGASNGAAGRDDVADASYAPCPPAKPGGHGGAGAGHGSRLGARPAGANGLGGAANGARNGAATRDGFVPLDARQARQALLAGSLNGGEMDAEAVIFRLEEAGQTLLALPSSGWSTRLRTTRLDVVRNAIEGYGWDAVRDGAAQLRPAVPDAACIDRMDEALGWIPLIPRDRYVLRRIVGARSLVSPVTDRYLFTWRRLGSLLGADHKAIQRWHAQGIDLIVKALRAGATRAA